MTESITNEINEKEFKEMYYIVKNIEEQYSIWPSYKKIPNGWEVIGESRIKSECLAYIDQNWTDMRPLSLKQQMQEISKSHQ